MKKIILILILGFITVNGFSIQPIDPPAKTDDGTVVATTPTPSVSDDCLALQSLVTVTITINITDCPMRCGAPMCTLYLRLYDDLGNTIQLIQFTGACSYTSSQLRLEEGSNVNVAFYMPPPGCTVVWNTGIGHALVPTGGGSMSIGKWYCP